MSKTGAGCLNCLLGLQYKGRMAIYNIMMGAGAAHGRKNGANLAWSAPSAVAVSARINWRALCGSLRIWLQAAFWSFKI